MKIYAWTWTLLCVHLFLTLSEVPLCSPRKNDPSCVYARVSVLFGLCTLNSFHSPLIIPPQNKREFLPLAAPCAASPFPPSEAVDWQCYQRLTTPHTHYAWNRTLQPPLLQPPKKSKSWIALNRQDNWADGEMLNGVFFLIAAITLLSKMLTWYDFMLQF